MNEKIVEKDTKKGRNDRNTIKKVEKMQKKGEMIEIQ